MKHGNTMKLYKILRSHDFRIMAQIKGYEFAVELQRSYERKFPENKFIITDQNNNKNEGRKRRKPKPRAGTE